MTTAIKDFGEKIGGAKKDLWTSRGFEIGDLEGMTSREYGEYVKKNYVWAVPNFKQEVENGMSPVVAYYIKKFRDLTPATPRPNSKNREYVEIFINTLNIYKSEIAKIETEEDILGITHRIKERMKAEGVTLYREYNKPLSALNYDEHELNKLRFKTEVQNFPEEYTGNIGGVTVYGGEFSRGERENKYFATKGSRIIVVDKDTKEELKDGIQEWAGKKAKAKTRAKAREIERPKVTRLRPVGPDYRGGEDVRGEDYLETFKLRGGEFGNWNSQTERQEFLNLGYDALKDLATAAEIPDSLISLGGYEDQKLAIAFGARGSGRAKAHYEPSKVVINLTKMKGAGSLAHEWGHALDDFIGIKTKNVSMLSNKRLYSRKTDKHPEVIKAFRGVMNAITERPRTLNEAETKQNKAIARFNQQLDIRVSNMTRVYDATVEQAQKLAVAREKFLSNPTDEGVEELAAKVKSVSGRIPPKSRRDELKAYVTYHKPREEIKPTEDLGTERSHYVTEALRMDKTRSKGYYVKYEELFARAFESFIEDELNNQGIESNYLVYGTKNEMYANVFAEGDDKNPLKPYPEGDERERINAAFRVLMVEIVRAFGETLTPEQQAQEEEERKAKFMIVEFKNACKERELSPDMGETEERDGKYIIKLGKGYIKNVIVPKNTVGTTVAKLQIGDLTEKEYEYTKPEESFYDYDALADYIQKINTEIEEEEAEEIDLADVVSKLQEIGLSYVRHEEFGGITDITMKNRGITGLQIDTRVDILGSYAIHRENKATVWGRWEEGGYNLEKIIKEVSEVMEEEIKVKEEPKENKKEEPKERVEINTTRIKQRLYGKVKLIETVRTDEAVMLVFDNGVVYKSMRYVQKVDKAYFEYAGNKETEIVIKDNNFDYETIAAKVLQLGGDSTVVLEEPEGKGVNTETRLEELKKAVQTAGMRLTILKDKVGVFYYPAKKGEKKALIQQGFPQKTVFSHAKTRFGYSKDSVEAMARREKGDLLEVKVDLSTIIFDKETGLFITRVPLEVRNNVWVEKGSVIQSPITDLRETMREAAGIQVGVGVIGSDVIERMIANNGVSIHYNEIPKQHRNGINKNWAITKNGGIIILPSIKEPQLTEVMLEAYTHIKLTERGKVEPQRVMLKEGIVYLMGIKYGLPVKGYCEAREFKMLQEKGPESVYNYIKQVITELNAISL